MNKRQPGGGGLAVAVIFVLAAGLGGCAGKAQAPAAQTVKPYYGMIQITVSTAGTVQPYNRVALKPPIIGRIEEILVQEGDRVKRGQILAWMSSTERAALLDAARAEGEKSVQAWADVYKPAPVISPIAGTVIVRSVLPGQTVSTADNIYVLSDRLIVVAQVDETDIGKVRVGQPVTLSLDAYPAIRVPAHVDHVEYESKIINNVIIYQVAMVPDRVPAEFRSGMSANADIVVASKEQALLVPREAVQTSAKDSYVSVSLGPNQKAAPRQVQVGLSNDKVTEIVSGVTPEDTLVIQPLDLSLLQGPKTKTNPFMPQRPSRRGGGGGGAH